MPELSLKEKLINKLNEINDTSILEEVANLFELQEPETIYQVNKKQKDSIEAAQKQIKDKLTLDNEQTNKEVDEWLN